MNSTNESFEVNRPEIVLEDFDLDKVVDVDVEGDDCLYIQIPVKCTISNLKLYDITLQYFYNQYVNKNGNDDITEYPTTLNFVVDNYDGDKSYFINTFVKIGYLGNNEEVCMSKQIQLSDIEKLRVDLILLKFTNPKEYLRQYTRQQFANMPQIKNKLGFVTDEIDEQQLYLSVWMTPDFKECLIGCIPKADNPKSKMQIMYYNKVNR